MTEHFPEFQRIIERLQLASGLDFSCWHRAFFRRRLNKRMTALECAGYEDYLSHFSTCPSEAEQLMDALTVNVSTFFRNPLTFDFLSEILLPPYLERRSCVDNTLRVWSAGCSCGEEPYTMAIIISELLRKEQDRFKVNIFGTDVDWKALEQAQTGQFCLDAVREVRHGLLNRYFTREQDTFTVVPEIRSLVDFSCHDMADPRHCSPPASVFGSFDLVLCRNLLIYFRSSSQGIIFDKLVHSLARNGYLVLGESEEPLPDFRKYFRKLNEFSHIYQKI